MPNDSATTTLDGFIKIERDAIAKIEAAVAGLGGPGEIRAMPFRDAATVQLALGRCWLGKALGSLGEPTPYPQSDNPENTIIEPPAYNKPNVSAYVGSEPVATIKQARKNVSQVVDDLSKLALFGEDASPRITDDFRRCVVLSKNALETARMMLGEELGILGGH